MEQASAVRFFLGANSARGFYSLYEGFTDPAAGDFLWVIKGGPGCGKSTFMKHIAAAAEGMGLPVEYIHCSGDPDSLDGVWLPTRKTGYVDGTAPHVQEAQLPGAAGLYLDLGRFLDDGALRPRLEEIASLNRRYKALYAEAYALLAAGAALLPRNLAGIAEPAALARAEQKAAGLAARELPRGQGRPLIRRRFLSAVSCQGRITFSETVSALCDRAIVLDNALGLGNVFLARFAALAEERGNAAVLCPDPLEPERIEALLLPETGLALLTDEAGPLPASLPFRRIRLDALPDHAALAAARGKLRRRKKDSAALLDRGMETLAEAKALHDALEAVYRPHVDFSGVSALAESHAARLLG